jgi:Holliday junction resolvase
MARLKNTKQKGNRNEHRTMRLLEEQGYRCSRSAASLGCWDVVGIGSKTTPFHAVLVQVKSNCWPRRKEMAELTAFEVPDGIVKLVHRWKDRKRAPDEKVIP